MKIGEIWRAKENKSLVKITEIKYETYNENFGLDYVVYYAILNKDKISVGLSTSASRKMFLNLYEKI